MLYNKHHNKEIKTFVLRQGKITSGQKNAINQLMPTFGINYTNNLLDMPNIFNSNNPVIIEIGFGMGHATWQIAKNNPNNNYIGIEVHSPGVGSLLMSIKEHNINNLKIIQYDAVEVLKHMIANNTIAGFHIYFPDPWHKKRHHKRRIIQEQFIILLVDKLIYNGYIHLATDYENYAHWILDILERNPSIKNSAINNTFISRPEFRPLTKFEQRGINLGHTVWDIMFNKIEEFK